MATVTTTSRIRLDWSKLLGFDQAEPVEATSDSGRRTAPALNKLGTKVGVKTGAKSGLKTRC